MRSIPSVAPGARYSTARHVKRFSLVNAGRPVLTVVREAQDEPDLP